MDFNFYNNKSNKFQSKIKYLFYLYLKRKEMKHSFISLWLNFYPPIDLKIKLKTIDFILIIINNNKKIYSSFFFLFRLEILEINI